MKRVFLIGGFLFVFMIFNQSLVSANDDLVKIGKEAYGMNCARCHGPEGKGDGPDANHLTVAPRDLTSGRFKFKSTVSGTPPSDQDIAEGIIGHGLTGSGMPSFAGLDSNVKKALVAYIKSISPAFQNNVEPEPIALPSNYKAALNVEKGKEVYETFKCAACHGVNGRANGSSAFTLQDAWGRPIRAANLTKGWTYRGGSRPIDIYHRILAGIDGAPMPSYEGAASHEDIWQLSQYVASLQLDANWSTSLVGLKVNNPIDLKLNDPVWKKAPRTEVNLQTLEYKNGNRKNMTVNAVSVQAIYNNDSVAFRLVWDDPVKDAKGDAIMIALKPTDYKGDPRGNLHTLYESNAPELDLALWDSSDATNLKTKKINLASAARAGLVGGGSLDAVSSYEDGQWTLVFVRPLNLNSTDPIEIGVARSIGFGVWDSNNGEAGLSRPVSQWLYLKLGVPETLH